MKVAHLSDPAEERVVFRDGLGVRERRETGTGEVVEWLHLDPAFAAAELPLHDRVTRLAKFQHVKFARILSLEPARKDRGPILLSSHVAGSRLAEVLEMAGHGLVAFDPGVGLHVTREVLGGLSVLHDSRNVAHGALGPERVVLTASGRVVIVEHVLGPALDRLQRPRHQLWREWRIPTPPSAGSIRMDMQTDLAQAGLLALAALLGRPVDEEEYPHRLRGLLPIAQDRLARSAAAGAAAEVVAWLERLVPVDSRRAFKTVREAQHAFEGLMSGTARAMGTSTACVKSVMAAVSAITTAPAASQPAAPAAGTASPAPAIVVSTASAESGTEPEPAPAPEDDIDIDALLRLEAELEGDAAPAAGTLHAIARERVDLERQFADLVAAVAPAGDGPVHLIPETPATSEPLVDARVLWSSMPADDADDAVVAAAAVDAERTDPVDVTPTPDDSPSSVGTAVGSGGPLEPQVGAPVPDLVASGAPIAGQWSDQWRVDPVSGRMSEATDQTDSLVPAMEPLVVVPVEPPPAAAIDYVPAAWWREALPWRADDGRVGGDTAETGPAEDVPCGQDAERDPTSRVEPGPLEVSADEPSPITESTPPVCGEAQLDAVSSTATLGDPEAVEPGGTHRLFGAFDALGLPVVADEEIAPGHEGFGLPPLQETPMTAAASLKGFDTLEEQAPDWRDALLGADSPAGAGGGDVGFFSHTAPEVDRGADIAAAAAEPGSDEVSEYLSESIGEVGAKAEIDAPSELVVQTPAQARPASATESIIEPAAGVQADTSTEAFEELCSASLTEPTAPLVGESFVETFAEAGAPPADATESGAEAALETVAPATAEEWAAAPPLPVAEPASDIPAEPVIEPATEPPADVCAESPAEALAELVAEPVAAASVAEPAATRVDESLVETLAEAVDQPADATESGAEAALETVTPATAEEWAAAPPLPVAEAASDILPEPAIEPATEAPADVCAESPAEALAELVTDPVTELVAEPASDVLTAPANEPATEPPADVRVESPAEALAELVADPAADLVAEPAADLDAQQAAESVPEPVSEPVSEPLDAGALVVDASGEASDLAPAPEPEVVLGPEGPWSKGVASAPELVTALSVEVCADEDTAGPEPVAGLEAFAPEALANAGGDVGAEAPADPLSPESALAFDSFIAALDLGPATSSDVLAGGANAWVEDVAPFAFAEPDPVPVESVEEAEPAAAVPELEAVDTSSDEPIRVESSLEVPASAVPVSEARVDCPSDHSLSELLAGAPVAGPESVDAPSLLVPGSDDSCEVSAAGVLEADAGEEPHVAAETAEAADPAGEPAPADAYVRFVDEPVAEPAIADVAAAFDDQPAADASLFGDLGPIVLHGAPGLDASADADAFGRLPVDESPMTAAASLLAYDSYVEPTADWRQTFLDAVPSTVDPSPEPPSAPHVETARVAETVVEAPSIDVVPAEGRPDREPDVLAPAASAAPDVWTDADVVAGEPVGADVAPARVVSTEPAEGVGVAPEVVVVDDGPPGDAWEHLTSEEPAAIAPVEGLGTKRRRKRTRRKKAAGSDAPAPTVNAVAPSVAVPTRAEPPTASPVPSMEAPAGPAAPEESSLVTATRVAPSASPADQNLGSLVAARATSLLNREVPEWKPPADLFARVVMRAPADAIAPDVPLVHAVGADSASPGADPPPLSVASTLPVDRPVMPVTPVSPAPVTVSAPDVYPPFEEEIKAVGMPDLDDLGTPSGRSGITPLTDGHGVSAPPSRVVPLEPRVAVPMDDTARGTKWRRLAAAAVLIALLQGVGFAAWWWAQPGETGTLVVQTSRTGVEVLLDDKVVGQTPFREDVAPGRHKLGLRLGSSVREMPVEISLGVVTTQSIDWPSPSGGRGSLQVTSSPAGAQVFVDGKSRGAAPLLLEDLAAGNQELELRSDAGSVTVKATVVADQTTPLEVKIFAGWILVDAPVEVNLLLNGRQKIGSSMDGQILLPPGPHRVQAVNETLGIRQWFSVTVEPGAVRRVPFTVTPGTLTLQEEAEVFVDGSLAGTTPGTIRIAPGTRDIAVRPVDGPERRQALTVRSGQRIEF